MSKIEIKYSTENYSIAEDGVLEYDLKIEIEITQLIQVEFINAIISI